MKKAVFLPVLMVAGLALQAWAAWTACTGDYAGYCLWDSGCHQINRGEDDTKLCPAQYNDCLENGYLFNDDKCTEWSEKGNDPSFTGVYCKWPTGCEKVKSQEEQDNCEENSTSYSDDKCTEYLGGRDPNAVPLGCCNWDNPEDNPDGDKCWPILESETDAEKKVKDCKTGKNIFWNACPATPGACPTSTPVYNGRSSSSVIAGNSSSSTATTTPSSSSAGTVDNSSSSETIATPSSSSTGTVVGNSSSSSVTTTPSSSSTGTVVVGSSSSTTTGGSSSSGTSGSSQEFEYCVYAADRLCLKGPFTTCSGTGLLSNSCPPGYDGGDVSPIVVLSNLGHHNGLGVMQNAVNLQITGSTVLQIFDLKGNAVRTLKFEQGNYIVPLSDLPNGLYIVKASSTSWKHTIKATVR